MVFGDGGFAWTAIDIAIEKSRIEAAKKDPSLRYYMGVKGQRRV